MCWSSGKISYMAFILSLQLIIRYRYEALRNWDKHLKSQDSEYWVQLLPGTVVGAFPYFVHLMALYRLSFVAIDNHRVLHGRAAFNGERRMCGAYIGIDDFRSRLAVLTERYDSHEGRPIANRLRRERSVWSSWF